MPLRQDREELLEQPPELVSLTLPARDRDVVAADDDLGVERVLDELQQLVAMAEQRHHRLVPGDDDLDLCDRHVVGAYPGGQPMPRPPRRWKCRCRTLCPASGPTLVTRRHPPFAIPSASARCDAVRKISTRRRRCASSITAADSMWPFGMIRMCVG